MGKSIDPMGVGQRKRSRERSRPPLPALIVSLSLRPGIPWRVALQHCPPPLPRLAPCLATRWWSTKPPPQPGWGIFNRRKRDFSSGLDTGSTSRVSDGFWVSLWLASLPPARGLSADSCSRGRDFVPSFLKLSLCSSLRLPPSVPMSPFHLTRYSPCRAHLRRPPGRRSSRPSTRGRRVQLPVYISGENAIVRTKTRISVHTQEFGRSRVPLDRRGEDPADCAHQSQAQQRRLPFHLYWSI